MDTRQIRMRRIRRLDGQKMTDRQSTHAYLKKRLCFPDYYGNNLDALYDLLTEIGEPQRILLYCVDELKRNQPEYGRSLLKVLRAAEQANANLEISFIDGIGEMPEEYRLKILREEPQDADEDEDYELLVLEREE